MAVDKDHVYWAEQQGPGGLGTLKRCPALGCGDSPEVIASGLRNPRGLALDDSNAYWTEAGHGPQEGRIWAVRK